MVEHRGLDRIRELLVPSGATSARLFLSWLIVFGGFLGLSALLAPADMDQAMDARFGPFAKSISEIVFLSIEIRGAELPLIVLWLIVGAVFFTFYLRFINLRGFVHALRIVFGKVDAEEQAPGEVTHFQALATAVSGTVGVGNIVHVAVAISIGGPGATFWLILAGFLGMASKFVECTLGVAYRQENPDGSVSGGPMFYLDKGLAERGWPRLGKSLAWYYAVCIIGGTLGASGMFQANQAYQQFVSVTGGEGSFFSNHAWVFGALLAVVVGLVTVGGIRSIARVTSRLVPGMACLYLIMALIVIGANIERLPWAIGSIVSNAFTPQAWTGGLIAVLILGFRRAAFSNEAGIGSASIAHSAVRTKEPLTQGFVAMLEPFIDTVVICTLTALTIIVTVYDPSGSTAGEMKGVELTSRAVGSVVSWFPYLLAVVMILFAFSTMISWSYYGLEGCIYAFGPSPIIQLIYNAIFGLFLVIGCTTDLKAVLDFSDAMIFAMALANILGLYILAPKVKGMLDAYWTRVNANE